MSNLNFIKTLTAGFALAIALYPQAWALQTGDCGPNCIYTYENGTLTYSVKDPKDPTPAVINKNNQGFYLQGSVQNVIVNEGITAIKKPGYGSAALTVVGSQGGKLTLPSTLTEFEYDSTYSMRFSTIEINSTNLTIPHLSMYNTGPSGTINIIMMASENLRIDQIYCEGHNFNGTLNVQCKGDESVCEESLASLKARTESLGGHYQSDYYRATDADGNVIQYHDTGYYTFDKEGNLMGRFNLSGSEQYDEKGNVIARYDTDGNLLGQYAYDFGGNIIASYDKNGVATYKRTSYTPAEAAAAVKKGNHNTVTLIFK